MYYICMLHALLLRIFHICFEVIRYYRNSLDLRGLVEKDIVLSSKAKDDQIGYPEVLKRYTFLFAWKQLKLLDNETETNLFDHNTNSITRFKGRINELKCNLALNEKWVYHAAID